jgi:hypothetical protein
MTMQQTAFESRRGGDRGTTDLGWLHSRHSFAFGAYRNPARMAYRSLRVLNDDIVEPGRGFGVHRHDNMEILSWVLDGELTHEDSTGTRGVIRPGDVQMMTAGAGINHSEMNASPTDPVHFIQIWIEPAEQDLPPAYTQKNFPHEGRHNRWQHLISPEAHDGSLRIHQDACLSIAELDAGAHIDATIGADRYGYVHLATGDVCIGDELLTGGDAVTFTGPGTLRITAEDAGRILFFDLA